MNHSMVSHGSQGKSQLFSWTQKVPPHWGLGLHPQCFLFSQMPLGNCHPNYTKLLAVPGISFFFFFQASLTWNILMLQSLMCFLSFHLPSLLLILILQITTQASTETAQEDPPGLLSSPVSIAPWGPPWMSMFHCNLWWLSHMCDFNIKGKRPRLWTLRAPGSAWYRTDNEHGDWKPESMNGWMMALSPGLFST